MFCHRLSWSARCSCSSELMIGQMVFKSLLHSRRWHMIFTHRLSPSSSKWQLQATHIQFMMISIQILSKYAKLPSVNSVCCDSETCPWWPADAQVVISRYSCRQAFNAAWSRFLCIHLVCGSSHSITWCLVRSQLLLLTVTYSVSCLRLTNPECLTSSEQGLFSD